MSTTTTKKPRPWRTLILVAAGAIIIGGFLYPRVLGGDSGEITETGPVEIYAAIEDGEVSSAVLKEGERTITVELKDGRTLTGVYTAFETPELIGALRAADVQDTTIEAATPPNRLVEFFRLLFPLFLIGAFLLYFLRGSSGIAMRGFGGKTSEVESPDVKFSDVIGADEAVAELEEDFADFLKNPEKYKNIGAKVPRGALLIGEPGVGKTLLAKALASEAGVPFFSVSGSDFVEVFAGTGAKRVRSLFEAAKKHPAAIIFIDEIDTVGKARGGGGGSGAAEERENTLTALLTEIDGFEGSGVIVLAATNIPDVLDPALTRSGRLERKITVGLPDVQGRKELYTFYLRDAHLDSTFDDMDTIVSTLARRSRGMSGADIARVVNEAKIIAAITETEKIRVDFIGEALERISMGREKKNNSYTEEEARIVAYHEAGHTLCSVICDETHTPLRVSIVPRGWSGGATWLDPGENERLITRPRMLDDLVVAYGGRAAEKSIMDGEFTQGAANDIKVATASAMAMICDYGMSDKIGAVAVDKNQLIGEDAQEIRAAASEILSAAERRADTICVKYRGALDALVEALVERESIESSEIEDIINRFR